MKRASSGKGRTRNDGDDDQQLDEEYVNGQVDDSDDENGDGEGPSTGRKRKAVKTGTARGNARQSTQTQPRSQPNSGLQPGRQGRKSGAARSQEDDENGPLEFSSADMQRIQQKIELYRREADARCNATPLDLRNDEIETLIGKVVRYMLFSNYEKPGVPVARAKLSEVITSDYKEKKNARQMPHVIIALAQERILKVAGLEMCEVERPTARQKEEAKGTSFYVLRSALPDKVRAALIGNPHGDKGISMGFTLAVLSIIHLSGGEISEDLLWENLGDIAVAENDEHCKLGKIKDLINKMIDCRYLIKVAPGRGGPHSSQIAGGARQGVVYRWGECADTEIGQERIREYIAWELDAKNKGMKAPAAVVEHASHPPPEVIELSISD